MSALDEKLSSLSSLDDVGALVRVPYNLLVAGTPPSWLTVDPYDPSGYRGRSVEPLAPVSFDEGYRIPLALFPYAFSLKRSMLEGRDDRSDVLSLEHAGLYLPGSRIAKPHGVFTYHVPPRWIYALAIAAGSAPVFFVPSSGGIEQMRSSNRMVPKPLRKALDAASHERAGSLGIERIVFS